MEHIAQWTAEKLERGSQIIVIIKYDEETIGHLTFWKSQEEQADLWLKMVSQMNDQSSSS